ncbi:MAG TPA: ATP-binding protein [Sphingobacterium sp.]|nr:ATP-binding protein [Sphingobacterium sp.]
MLITDSEILNYIRKTYAGYSNYVFKDLPIVEEDFFIVVKDIHEVNNDHINISKDVFIRGLHPNRQTNSINIMNICDSVNAETGGLGEEIYQAIEQYNKIYTKAFLRNGSRWVDLKAFNLCCDKAKEIMGNNNPRILFNISKYTHLLNLSSLNSSNLRLSLVGLRSCLELMHLEIRKMNYDMIMRPITTLSEGKDNVTLVATKYVTNFALHRDIKFDHEFQVFGTIAGLSARKNRGRFGEIRAFYYQFDLVSVLRHDYGYLELQFTVEESIKAPIFIHNKQIAHKVLLRRKTITSNFAGFSKLTSRLIPKYSLSKETYIYDYDNPVELNTIPIQELKTLLDSGEGMLVYLVDETLYDNEALYDAANALSGIIIEKGEMFNAHSNLFGIKYSRKVDINSIWSAAQHILIFSKSLQADQIQRVKLFDSMMEQQRHAIIRAEQAEKAVAEYRSLYDEMQVLNLSLKERVLERTKELEMVHQQQTTTFVNMLHETKTPLTLINNYIDEYTSKVESTPELEIIKNNISKLSKDISNMFDLEKFNKGIEAYNHDQVTDLTSLIKENLVLFQHYACKKNIHIQSQIDNNVHLKADHSAIYRIFNNVLDNAIKFSDHNSTINVSLTRVKDNKLLLSVTDEGPGIEKKLQKKIFEPYFQIVRQKSSMQGMGLGLPLVKKIVEQLNGSIRIDSDPALKKGTTILITLHNYEPPIEEDIVRHSDLNTTFSTDFNDNDAEDLPELKFSKNLKTIMIIEDNRNMLHYLIRKFDKSYNVIPAISGSDALHLLKTLPYHPDLVLSDHMMDNIDGIAFGKILANSEKYSHIPLILLTADTTPGTRHKALQIGAIDILYKPFSFHELHQKITSVLNTLERQKTAFFNTYITRNPVASEIVQSPEGFQNIYGLTARECNVVELLKEGYTYEQIGEKLFISGKTAKKHAQNIFRKVGVSNKIHLLQKLQA